MPVGGLARGGQQGLELQMSEPEGGRLRRHGGHGRALPRGHLHAHALEQARQVAERIDSRGDLVKGLARYNGSVGKPEYPNMVIAAWRGRWKYDGPTA